MGHPGSDNWADSLVQPAFYEDGGRCGNNADFLQVVCFEEADGFFDDAENRNADSVSDLVNKHMK